MSAILVIAKILTIVGGLNWGLVGAFNYNLVDVLFGEGSTGSKIVYIIVGVAALVTIIDLFTARYAREPDIVASRPIVDGPGD